MKFAKRLEAEAVAEWRPKYLQYKQLKKAIKRIVDSRQASSPTSRVIAPAVDVEKRAHSSGSADDEVLFFDLLLTELSKIEDFYRAREKEAIDRKFKIMAQLHILPTDKRRRRADQSPSDMGDDPLSVMTWRSLQPPGRGATGLAVEGTVSPDTQLSQSPRQNAGEKEDLPEHLKISSLRGASFTHLARLRIKKALLEFYRSLELLRSFKSLNALGVAKILKKYDKNTGQNMSPAWMSRLGSYSFYTSGVVDSLMDDIENIYRWVFTDGDRSKALRKLRIKDFKNKTFHSSAMVGGLLLGLCIAVLVRIFHWLSQPDRTATTYSLALMYFGFGLPFMMAWLFAINALVWDMFYINYRFIFEFNQRNNLQACQYSSLVGLFTFGYLVLVSLSLEGFFDGIMSPLLQPWLVIGILMALLLLPLPILCRSSRFWFARVLVRIATAPFYPCRFKDFFINDQYMSFPITFELFGMLLYFTFQSESQTVSSVGIPHLWYVYVLSMLPGIWRSLQCIRRFHDSRMAFPHLANLAKYMCSLAVQVVILAKECGNMPKLYWALVAFRFIASTFSLGWDIVMDFGLWQRSPNNDRLRGTILFKPWIYWYLIVSDTVARYLWVLALLRDAFWKSGGLLSGIQLKVILATIEALRRFQWNFFRVEYEHVNNCNGLRAVADVQLPFMAADLFYQDMVETMQKQRDQQILPSPTSTDESAAIAESQDGPSSTIASDLDDDDVTYEQQMEMIQKSAAANEGMSTVLSAEHVPPPSAAALHSGWGHKAENTPLSVIFKKEP